MTIGEKLRNLRAKQGLLLREVAANMEVDTAFISKLEHNEKTANKSHIKTLARLYKVTEKELLLYWLAEKVRKAISDEKFGKEALQIVLKEIE
jgi:transcriptional regulator with XRE-family HTH domain